MSGAQRTRVLAEKKRPGQPGRTLFQSSERRLRPFLLSSALRVSCSLGLQLSGKRSWRLDRTFRPMHMIGILELHRYFLAAVRQVHFLEDFRQWIRFEYREVAALFPLLRSPAKKIHGAGIVAGTDRVFHIRIRAGLVQFVIERR